MIVVFLPEVVIDEHILYQRSKFFDWDGPQIMLIDGDRFGVGEKLWITLTVIENRSRLVYAIEAERFDQFLSGKDLAVIARRPAQQDKKIVESPGEKTVLPIKLHGNDLTMTSL